MRIHCEYNATTVNSLNWTKPHPKGIKVNRTLVT